jgi:hypothetical protein
MVGRDFVRVLLVAGLIAAGASCSNGSGTPGNGEEIITSHQDLCAGVAPEHAGGYVTAIACPFEQHVDNFDKFGQKAPASAALYDGTGARVANLTNTCDEWALGVDPKGVTVIVKRSTGLIISHGAFHPGQALTNISSPLTLPVQTR